MSTPSRDLRQATALYALGVAAPVLAVLLARFAGPSSSHAAAPLHPPAVVPLPRLDAQRATADQAQTRALDRAAELEQSGVSASPFRNAGRAPAAPGSSSDTPEDEPESLAPTPGDRIEPPDLEVSGILSLRLGRLAIIDERFRREGDLVAPEWVLLSIDTDGRRLVVGHITGARSELSLAGP